MQKHNKAFFSNAIQKTTLLHFFSQKNFECKSFFCQNCIRCLQLLANITTPTVRTSFKFCFLFLTLCFWANFRTNSCHCFLYFCNVDLSFLMVSESLLNVLSVQTWETSLTFFRQEFNLNSYFGLQSTGCHRNDSGSVPRFFFPEKS